MLWLSWLLWVSVALAIPPAPKVALEGVERRFDALDLCAPSGLSIQVVQRSDTELVTMALVIEGGMAVEHASNRGAAHLLEHLWFRSHPGGGPTVWDRAVGIDVDGATNADATMYGVVGHQSHLRDLLALQVSALLDPLEGVSEADLYAEKSIVKRELLWRGEHTGGLAQRHLDALLFPKDHPYNRVMASSDDVAKLDMAALRSYVAENYVPENATLRVEGAVGKLDHSRWVALLNDVLPGDAIAGPPGRVTCNHPSSRDLPPAPVSVAPVQIGAPILRTQVWTGWSLPSAWRSDAQVLASLPSLVEGLVWGRLGYVAGLRGDQPASASCDLLERKQGSVLVCVAEVPNHVDPREVIAKIEHGLPDLWSKDVDRKHHVFRRVARRYTDAFRNADSLDFGDLSQRTLSAHRTGLLDALVPALVQLQELEDGPIDAMVAKYITRERMATVVLRPGDLPEVRGTPLDGSVTLRAPAEIPWTTPKPVWSGLTKRTLESGVVVWELPRLDTPVSMSALVFPGGEVHQPVSGLTTAELAILHRPYHAYEPYTWSLGVSTNNRWGTMARSYNAIAPAGGLRPALWMMRSMVSEASLGFENQQLYLDESIEGLEHMFVEDPSMISSHLRSRHLFGDDAPDSASWWASNRDGRRVSARDITRFRRAVLDPSQGSLLVVGAQPEGTAQEYAKQYFAKWKGKPADKLVALTTTAALPSRDVMVLDLHSVLSDVRVGCRLPGRSDANDAALDVAAEVVRMGLWQTMRDNGQVYTPFVSVGSRRPDLSTLTLTVSVMPNEAAGTVATLLALLGTASGDLSPSVVAAARAKAGLDHARESASAYGAWTTLRSRMEHGQSASGIREYLGRLNAVDVAAVAAVFADCSGHEAVTVTGPDPSLALQELGLPSRRVDWAAEGAAIVDSFR
jgi:zinc protease